MPVDRASKLMNRRSASDPKCDSKFVMFFTDIT